jgi:hypothetical protein
MPPPLVILVFGSQRVLCLWQTSVEAKDHPVVGLLDSDGELCL